MPTYVIVNNSFSQTSSASYYGYVFYNGSGAMPGFTVLLVADGKVLASAVTDNSGYFTISASYSGSEPIELVFPGYELIAVIAPNIYPPQFFYIIEPYTPNLF